MQAGARPAPASARISSLTGDVSAAIAPGRRSRSRRSATDARRRASSLDPSPGRGCAQGRVQLRRLQATLGPSRTPPGAGKAISATAAPRRNAPWRTSMTSSVPSATDCARSGQLRMDSTPGRVHHSAPRPMDASRQHEVDRRTVRDFLDNPAAGADSLLARLQLVPRVLAALNQRRGGRLDAHELADLAQDVVLLVLRKLDTFFGAGSFDGWLYRPTRIRCTGRASGRAVRSTQRSARRRRSSPLPRCRTRPCRGRGRRARLSPRRRSGDRQTEFAPRVRCDQHRPGVAAVELEPLRPVLARDRHEQIEARARGRTGEPCFELLAAGQRRRAGVRR